MSDDAKVPLPPLPRAYNADAVGKIVRDPGSQWSYVVSPMYTATQMIEYGRAVERAARAAECDAIGDILSDMLSRDEHDQPLDCAWNHALDALGDALRARAEGQR